MFRSPIARFLRRNAVVCIALAAICALTLPGSRRVAPSVAPTIALHRAPLAPFPEFVLPNGPVTLTDPDRPWSIVRGLPDDIAAGIRKVATQTVVVRNGEGSMQSGFIVRNGIIVTAAHILEGLDDAKKLQVDCDGTRSADILLCDHVRDIIIARAPDCKGKKLLVDSTPYDRARPVYLSGFNFFMREHSAQRYLTVTVPLIHAEFRPEDDHPEVPRGDERAVRNAVETARRLGIPAVRAIAGLVVPGNSGSPVFSLDGTVVGMVVMNDWTNTRTYIVPAANIRWALASVGIK